MGDGLTMIPWAKGRSLVWDFTVSDTLSSSHVHQTSQEVAKSAIKAEERKLSHYKQLATSGFIVMPVAAETLGSWGPMALSFIKDIGSRIKDVTGDKRATSHLFQRLSICIQRGNAASVMGTIPSGQQLNDLFYL